jgi:ComF family protein
MGVSNVIMPRSLHAHQTNRMPAHLHASTFARVLGRHIRSLLECVLPGCCALCGTISRDASISSNHSICKNCSEQFFKHENDRCPVCARKLMHSAHALPCGACQTEPPSFDASIVVCDYAAPADRLIQDLKFNARLALAFAFAQLLSDAVRQQGGIQADLIAAVPLSSARLAERGFNQASEIAKPLANFLDLTLELQLCTRVRETPAQAGLSLKERRLNMRGAFIVSPKAPTILNKHIILVDDVMTTGYTLNELAACLKRYGAARVTNLVFARTPLR